MFVACVGFAAALPLAVLRRENPTLAVVLSLIGMAGTTLLFRWVRRTQGQ